MVHVSVSGKENDGSEGKGSERSHRHRNSSLSQAVVDASNVERRVEEVLHGLMTWKTSSFECLRYVLGCVSVLLSRPHKTVLPALSITNVHGIDDGGTGLAL